MIWELILFILAGISSVATACVVYIALVSTEIDLLGSTILAYLAGMVVGFFINQLYTFKNTAGWRPKVLLKYISLYLFTLVLGASLNLMISEAFSFNLYHSFLLALAFTTIINFVGMKLWVFRTLY